MSWRPSALHERGRPLRHRRPPDPAPGLSGGVEYTLNGLEHYRVRVDIPGDFTVYNSLAAIALCRHLGVQREDILAALDNIQVRAGWRSSPPPGTTP